MCCFLTKLPLPLEYSVSNDSALCSRIGEVANAARHAAVEVVSALRHTPSIPQALHPGTTYQPTTTPPHPSQPALNERENKEI